MVWLRPRGAWLERSFQPWIPSRAGSSRQHIGGGGQERRAKIRGPMFDARGRVHGVADNGVLKPMLVTLA